MYQTKLSKKPSRQIVAWDASLARELD
jgi:hypothetical protein